MALFPAALLSPMPQRHLSSVVRCSNATPSETPHSVLHWIDSIHLDLCAVRKGIVVALIKSDWGKTPIISPGSQIHNIADDIPFWDLKDYIDAAKSLISPTVRFTSGRSIFKQGSVKN